MTGFNGRAEAISMKTNPQSTAKGEPMILSTSNMEGGKTAAFPSSAVTTNTFDRKSAPAEAKREFFDQIRNHDIAQS
jgi:hypothetical protein